MEHPGHCSQVDFGLARNAKSALRPCSLPAPKAHLESRTCPSRMRRSRGLKNRAPASEEAAATPFFRSWGGAGTRAFMRLRVLNNARIVYCIWPCKECESAPRPCSLPASKAHLESPTCPNRMRRGRDLKNRALASEEVAATTSSTHGAGQAALRDSFYFRYRRAACIAPITCTQGSLGKSHAPAPIQIATPQTLPHHNGDSMLRPFREVGPGSQTQCL